MTDDDWVSIKFRECIAELCIAERPFEDGEVEVDGRYRDVHRVHSIRDEGIKGKIPVSGMLNKTIRFYT